MQALMLFFLFQCPPSASVMRVQLDWFEQAFCIILLPCMAIVQMVNHLEIFQVDVK